MMTTPARPFDVLLVEDDVADAMLIEEALAERGARNLVQVTDGVAALEHLRGDGNARPDLIVLDLNMPRMNGRELLKILKSDEDLQTIPVVVLTTSTAPDDVTAPTAATPTRTSPSRSTWRSSSRRCRASTPSTSTR